MSKNIGQEKRKFDSKFFRVGVMAFVVVALSMLFYFIVAKMNVIGSAIANIFIILQPIIIGLVIAYLTNPMMKLFDKLLVRLFTDKFKWKKCGNKLARGLSIFLSLLFFLLIIGALLWMVIPSLIASIASLAGILPDQIDKIIKWVAQFFETNERLSGVMTAFLNWIETDIVPLATSWAGTAVAGVVKTITFICDLAIGVIVAVYLLISKETFKAQFKKIVYAFTPKRVADGTLTVLRKSNDIFEGFINGTLISSLVVGILCFIGASVLGLPYAILISVIVGVTNVIPVFGPYIGGIVSALLILLVDPIKVIYFIIFIVILQALEGNIVTPKILGDYTGLSPFWVVFAIVLCGGLFGLVGMVIGVPLFAVCYYLINEAVRFWLKKKKLPVETEDYMTNAPVKEIEEVAE